MELLIDTGMGVSFAPVKTEKGVGVLVVRSDGTTKLYDN